jgi:exonuclease VII large subunit
MVTSPTGAAIQDFLNVLHRRQRGIEVVIFPVRVQGKGAAAEIAEAVQLMGNPSISGIGAVRCSRRNARRRQSGRPLGV